MRDRKNLMVDLGLTVKLTSMGLKCRIDVTVWGCKNCLLSDRACFDKQ